MDTQAENARALEAFISETVQGAIGALWDKVLGTLDDRFKRVDDGLGKLDENLSMVDGRLNNVETGLWGLEQRLTSLETGVAPIDGRLTVLDGRFTTLEGGMTKVQSDLGAAQIEASRMRRQLLDIQYDVDRVGRTARSERGGDDSDKLDLARPFLVQSGINRFRRELP